MFDYKEENIFTGIDFISQQKENQLLKATKNADYKLVKSICSDSTSICVQDAIITALHNRHYKIANYLIGQVYYDFDSVLKCVVESGRTKLAKRMIIYKGHPRDDELLKTAKEHLHFNTYYALRNVWGIKNAKTKNLG